MLLYNKDYIEFVTEFPCLLGHPVGKRNDLEIQVTDCRRIYLKTSYPGVSSTNYSALKLLTFFQESFTMEPGWAHSRDFIEILNPNLWQIGHGFHEL